MNSYSTQKCKTEAELKRALALALEAGRILLKNGAEIFRAEESIKRICHSFGIENIDVFILSHALFVSAEINGEIYTRVKAVPLSSAHLGIVAEVNNLSRMIAENRVGLEEACEKLKAINRIRPLKNQYHIVAAGMTSICFGALLGAGLVECICAFVIGCLVWCWCILANKLHMSKVVVNLVGGIIITILAIFAVDILPFSLQIHGMIIGAIMPLIPGITFVNAIRDIAGGDFLCGTVRMLDALFVFVYIAAGVGIVLGVYNNMIGGIAI